MPKAFKSFLSPCPIKKRPYRILRICFRASRKDNVASDKCSGLIPDINVRKSVTACVCLMYSSKRTLPSQSTRTTRATDESSPYRPTPTISASNATHLSGDHVGILRGGGPNNLRLTSLQGGCGTVGTNMDGKGGDDDVDVFVVVVVVVLLLLLRRSFRVRRLLDEEFGPSSNGSTDKEESDDEDVESADQLLEGPP